MLFHSVETNNSQLSLVTLKGSRKNSFMIIFFHARPYYFTLHSKNLEKLVSSDIKGNFFLIQILIFCELGQQRRL